MGRNLQQLMRRKAEDTGDLRWLDGLEAFVAINQDPEFQHRIKVVIPALDEDRVYDKWVRSLGVIVLGPGYGSFFVPPKGTEVILFSRLASKHNLFYFPVYNEDIIVPADFRDTAVAGIRAPGDLRFICDGDMQLRMGGGEIRADSGALRLSAPGGVFINDREY